MGRPPQGQTELNRPASPPSEAGVVLSCLAGLTACWVAAGSVGLLAHPLRRTLVALLLAVAALVVTRWQPLARQTWFKLVPAVVPVVACLAAPYPILHVLACALALGWMAAGRLGEASPLPRAAAQASLVFALYQFAVTLIPYGWWLGDAVARGISRAVTLILPWPLEVGPSFAGFDYQVLPLAFCLLLIRRLNLPGKRALALRWIAAILVAHGLYLVLLAAFPKWREWLPEISIRSAFAGMPGRTKPMGEVILWQLPLLGFLLQLPVLALAAWRLGKLAIPTTAPAPTAPARTVSASRDRHSPQDAPAARGLGRWLQSLDATTVAALILALLVPVLTLLQPKALSLQGRKIVVYEKGFLNWLRPQHGEYGRLTIGMYGIWPTFFERYGARCVISPELSAQDIEGADLLVLIFPNKPWEPGQLERIQNYVARGGTLLLLGEHTAREKDGSNRFNDVLGPTAMRVAFDSAMFGVGGWLHSYLPLAHPAAMGIRDDRNQFGVVIGASVEARLPARPILLGRWGWNDPGDATNDESKGGSMMGNQKYDAGERLGDVLLAADQRWGRGRVVVFGDTSGFTNGILYGSHPYVAALFAALCQRAEIAGWRFVIGLLGLVGLGALIVRKGRPQLTVATVIVLAAATAGAATWTARMANVLPDGRTAGPNMLAYLDTTHLERASGESWRLNGLGALHMTLMRNGYLVLSLPEFTEKRLERAGLVFSAAPGRPFTKRERAVVRRFVENGGIFIITVGWPESAASRSLLADFGFHIGGRGAAEALTTEPKPFGHFKAPYYNGGDYMAYVRFHAAWMVESSQPGAQPLAYGPRQPLTGTDPMVIQIRRLGRGKFVVVADSDFATCQNLENEGGQPFEGLRENADFWRWLVPFLNDQPGWVPPKPVLPARASAVPAAEPAEQPEPAESTEPTEP